ncbi:helix-hairpin-helix domain-containing protein [Halarcobacter bivalviorum]|uniref:Helix-hairpin-helix domain-containing protein n=1 Tax=Halarcobacter bivalviorum TaxID=663364 RepID=A0AAX2AAA0_9BACT|nr:helix-hairpin-helix domain-containing protein [Halarcobacter bivalviorum]AXH12077.1 helix-hairpin-helix domain-containing protein [Halarcobacter bivalviorum]RXK11187.1 Pathogenicity locus [Halarcobacter bivalviorum]
MAFSKDEKEMLLKVKFVGETVISRFEQIGIDSLETLSKSSVEEITDIVSDILGSSCWKNSPQARKAVQNAINFAKEYQNKYE